MLERVWRKGNPLTLLVGMQTSTATMDKARPETQSCLVLPVLPPPPWTFLCKSKSMHFREGGGASVSSATLILENCSPPLFLP